MRRLCAIAALAFGCAADAPFRGAPDASPDAPAFGDAHLDAHDARACRPTLAKTYSGPGPDGVWGTSDDVLLETETATFGATGVPSSRAFYPGADTAASETWTCTYDATTHLDVCVGSSSIGIEKKQFDDTDTELLFETDTTADGVVMAYAKWAWAGGLGTESDYSTGAGADGVWGTDDDDWSEADTFAYDASGALRAIVFHRDGVAYAAELFECDPGAVISVGATAPGPDGVWGTDDDVLGPGRTVFTGDGCGGGGAGCAPIVN